MSRRGHFDEVAGTAVRSDRQMGITHCRQKSFIGEEGWKWGLRETSTGRTQATGGKMPVVMGLEHLSTMFGSCTT
jgi:hypothetical protein